MVGSGRQRDGRDAGESGEEVIDPGPVGGQPEVSASGAAGQPGRDVQQPVAQGFGFGCGQFSGQREQPQQAVRSAAIAVAVSQAWLIW